LIAFKIASACAISIDFGASFSARMGYSTLPPKEIFLAICFGAETLLVEELAGLPPFTFGGGVTKPVDPVASLLLAFDFSAALFKERGSGDLPRGADLDRSR